MTALAVVEPDRLGQLAAEIRDEVERAELAWTDVVRHAIRAGSLLIEAKSLLRHGEWLPWLRDNFPGSVRSASGYMKLAANEQLVANLPTLREALEALADSGSRPVTTPRPAKLSPGRGLEPLSPGEVDRLYVQRQLEDPEWAWNRALKALTTAVETGHRPPGVTVTLAVGKVVIVMEADG